MIIKKVEVKGFGKLCNKKVVFKEGIQVVYGLNENGKSTLMEFIKLMFYGNSGKAINSSMREKKIPWNGEKLGGSIEFEYKGKEYILQKEFNSKTPLRDKVLFFCVTDGTNISLEKKEEVGEKLLGIGVEDFEKSGYINCLGEGPFSSGKNIKEIILNLADTGDENISKNLAN